MVEDPPPALESGGRYVGHDLSGADWAERDLSDAAFEACTLADVQISAAILQGAKFVGCLFTRCRFAHADLREAVFERCDFADPDSHSGVDFAFSQLDQARFAHCDLSFADIDRSSLWDVTFQSCNLRGARFHRADFARAFGPKVVRSSAAFRDCNLELTDLSDAALGGCELVRCSFREADLTGADLERADLTGGDFFQALTAGARLAGADLRGAELSGLDLNGLASFAGIKITAAQQHVVLVALGVDVYPD